MVYRTSEFAEPCQRLVVSEVRTLFLEQQRSEGTFWRIFLLVGGRKVSQKKGKEFFVLDPLNYKRFCLKLCGISTVRS